MCSMLSAADILTDNLWENWGKWGIRSPWVDSSFSTIFPTFIKHEHSFILYYVSLSRCIQFVCLSAADLTNISTIEGIVTKGVLARCRRILLFSHYFHTVFHRIVLYICIHMFDMPATDLLKQKILNSKLHVNAF